MVIIFALDNSISLSVLWFITQGDRTIGSHSQNGCIHVIIQIEFQF